MGEEEKPVEHKITKPLVHEKPIAAPVVEHKKTVAPKAIEDKKPIAAPVTEHKKAVAPPAIDDKKPVAAPVVEHKKSVENKSEKPKAVHEKPAAKIELKKE